MFIKAAARTRLCSAALDSAGLEISWPDSEVCIHLPRLTSDSTSILAAARPAGSPGAVVTDQRGIREGGGCGSAAVGLATCAAAGALPGSAAVAGLAASATVGADGGGGPRVLPGVLLAPGLSTGPELLRWLFSEKVVCPVRRRWRRPSDAT